MVEKNIDRLFIRLRIEYILLWILSITLVVFYESGLLSEGIYAGDVYMDYILQTVGILLVICIIPFSLKLFNISLINRIKHLSFSEALKSYEKWSEIRIGFLFVPAIINLSIYYLTLNVTGALCACMALVASLFCIPNKTKILKELDIVK